jgi:geranylgeranyl pyrophosphate synthase
VASLYHDDIMDHAATRRGGASANSLWGNRNAATSGTHIFSRAVALLATAPPELLSAFSEATLTVTTGQLRETEQAFSLDVDPEDHLHTLAMKTAILFELPCRLGAQLAEADPPIIDALRRFGRNLGIAFQLTDDTLDLVGNPATLGKQTGIDLRQGIYTHSVLVAAQADPQGQLARLLDRADMSEQEAAEAVALVRQSGAIAATSELARQFAAQATEALDALPSGPVRATLRSEAARAVDRIR